MPIAMENALKSEALKKFGTTMGPKAGAYIYGTMNRMGKLKNLPIKGLPKPTGIKGILRGI